MDEALRNAPEALELYAEAFKGTAERCRGLER
jgi:predicted RNase H-like HicB family nuclease